MDPLWRAQGRSAGRVPASSTVAQPWLATRRQSCVCWMLEAPWASHSARQRRPWSCWCSRRCAALHSCECPSSPHLIDSCCCPSCQILHSAKDQIGLVLFGCDGSCCCSSVQLHATLPCPHVGPCHACRHRERVERRAWRLRTCEGDTQPRRTDRRSPARYSCHCWRECRWRLR